MQRLGRTAWVASTVLVSMIAFAARTTVAEAQEAGEECWTDPTSGLILCEDSGIIPAPGGELPGTPPPWGDDPGRRYVYTATTAAGDDCYYWSDVPGGLDAWDPANDPAVIAITTSLPLCPVEAISEPESIAWEIFRSWDLAEPTPVLTPPGVGITGLPTVLAAPEPPTITHAEVMPDGRPLEVRARIALMRVDWGDGTVTEHAPDAASPYPSGSVAHTYALKTCAAPYRAAHPSGSLCHPSLDQYIVDAAFVWVGEFRTGPTWTALGTLTTSSAVAYEVDEARGVPVP